MMRLSRMPVLRHGSKAILLMGCLVMQLSCERTYGISRGVNLSKFPDVECIENVLRGIPELLVVKRIGPPEHKTLQQFRYSGSGFWAYLSVQVELNGKVLFGHDRLMVDKRPRRNEISETRRMMVLVEQRLSVECSMPELRSGVLERLYNV